MKDKNMWIKYWGGDQSPAVVSFGQFEPFQLDWPDSGQIDQIRSKSVPSFLEGEKCMDQKAEWKKMIVGKWKTQMCE